MITFFRLLQLEVKLLFKSIKDNLINTAIFYGLVSLVSGYILKAFGTSDQFATLQTASLMVSAISFETYRSVFRLLGDIEGDRHIQYYFTLPMKNKMVFAKMICSFIITGLILVTSGLFILKVILPHHITLSKINFALFYLVSILSGSFFGSFSLLLSAYTPSTMKISNTFMRILFPLWIIGGFQFSYSIAKTISPILGNVVLISPFMYANEAMRYVIIGPESFMNIWVSLSVLIILNIVAWKLSIRKLKKRLDFI